MESEEAARSLDELNRELADIQDRLIALPADAFAERHELHKRRDAVKERVAAFSVRFEQERPTQDLLAELSGLRQRLAAIEGARIDLVVQSGGGTEGNPAGADGWGGVGLNQALDAAQGRAAVTARIGRIKGILADRGVEIPPG